MIYFLKIEAALRNVNHVILQKKELAYLQQVHAYVKTNGAMMDQICSVFNAIIHAKLVQSTFMIFIIFTQIL
mgnify:CR=1 FL=1